MTQIRHGVFETNSSSTHSICITRHAPLKFPKTLRFECREFGWENDVLRTPEDKAAYLYAACYELFSEREVEKIADELYETLGKYGVDCEFEKPERASYGITNVGIDHGDQCADFASAVLRSEHRLIRFLFSDESFIITGNDNDGTGVDIAVDYPHETYYKGN